MFKKLFAQFVAGGRLAVGIGLAWLGFMAGASAQAQPLKFTNAAVASGYFSVNVLAASNTTFTIETSTDLKNWKSALTITATGVVTTVDDPRPVSGFAQQYYRLALGSVANTLNFNFSFLEFANPGSFNGLSGIQGTGNPTANFPMAWNSYSAIFSVGNGTNYPPATSVFFTGPGGSGLTNAAADPANSNVSPGNASYQSPIIFNPADAMGGSWVVNYQGSNVTFNVSDPQVNSHIVMPYPTVTVTSGNLVNVSWVYRDATTGATLSGPPGYMQDIQLQVYGGTGTLYNSANLTPTTLSQTVSPSVPANQISGIGFAYDDTAGNSYVVSFGP